jgi:hypothetical protein
VVSLPTVGWADRTTGRTGPGSEHVSVTNEGDRWPSVVALGWRDKSRRAHGEYRHAVSTYALTRFHLTFGIPTLMLVSYRGDFGDGNWWGSSVGRVTEPVLRGLGISYEVVRSADQIPGAIRKADRSSAASLLPTAILLGFGSVGSDESTPNISPLSSRT